MIIRPNIAQYWNGNSHIQKVIDDHKLCIWRVNGNIAECFRYKNDWYHDVPNDVSKETLQSWIWQNGTKMAQEISIEDIIQFNLPL